MRRRQIFYLSARRHEPALWEQATGARPAVVDLAAVRFPAQVFAPEDYRVETPPALPAPNGRSAEEYAKPPWACRIAWTRTGRRAASTCSTCSATTRRFSMP